MQIKHHHFVNYFVHKYKFIFGQIYSVADISVQHYVKYQNSGLITNSKNEHYEKWNKIMVNSHMKIIQYSRLVTSRATRDITDTVLPFHLTTVRDLHLQTLKMPTRIKHTKISKAALRIVLRLLLFEVFKTTATQTAKLDCMHYKSRNLSTLQAFDFIKGHHDSVFVMLLL